MTLINKKRGLRVSVLKLINMIHTPNFLQQNWNAGVILPAYLEAILERPSVNPNTVLRSNSIIFLSRPIKDLLISYAQQLQVHTGSHHFCVSLFIYVQLFDRFFLY